MTGKTAPLENRPLSVAVRLAFMWAVIMFFYIYNDVFMLMQSLPRGAAAAPPSGPTMLAYAIIITPAALMPLLCLIARPTIVRWANIFVGLAYFIIIFLTLMPSDTPMFYRYIGVVEDVVTLGLIWTAWRWQRMASP